jgi:hypothetical protein
MTDYLHQLRTLPDAVREYVYSERRDRWYGDTYRIWPQLLDEARESIDIFVLEVIARTRSVQEFIAFVQGRVEDAKDAHVIIFDVLGNDLLNIEDHLGVDIGALIASLGGDVTKYVREVSVDDVVASITKELGMGKYSPVIASRFTKAVESYLNGVRDSRETMGILARSVKIGGVGFDDAIAKKVVDALKKRKDDFTGKKIQLHRAGASRRIRAPKPTFQEEDAAEIAQYRTTGARVARQQDVTALIEQVITRSRARFRSEDWERRFRDAVESRLRDVRDRRETLSLLLRTVSKGGLGIPAEKAARLSVLIEEVGDSRGKSEKPLATSTPPVARHKVSPSPSPVTPVIPLPKSWERQVVPQSTPSKRVVPSSSSPVKIVASPPSTHERPSVPAAPVVVPPPPPIVGLKTEIAKPRVVAKSRMVESSRVEPRKAAEREKKGVSGPATPTVLPEKQTAEARAIVMPQRVASRHPTQPTAPQRDTMVKAPPTKSQAGPAASGTARKKIHDIRSVAPRLVGPVEELQRIALADFRKIAKTPEEAAQRIVQKLDVLGEESYTKRAAGIRALRESPLMRSYTSLLNAALTSQTSVAKLLQSRQDEPGGMSKDEFDAIGIMNDQARF